MIKSVYDAFFLWLLPKLLLLSNALSDFIIKFAIYHLYYKNIFVNNPTRTFVCIANCFYFKYWLGSLGNLLTASLFARDGRAYITKPGLIIKKRKPPKTFLYIFYPDQPSFFLLGSILKNTPSDICMLGNSEYTIMCKWLFSLATY